MPILHSYYQDVYRCPIVRLDGYSAQHGLSTGILAYLDFGGATGSSKDGLAETMLAFATERGTLQPGMPVVEASSGSFGAALAASWEEKYHTRAIFRLFEVCSEGDDLIFFLPGTRFRFPMLRQQHPSAPGEPNLCLADFIRPLSRGIRDQAGVFCTSVDGTIIDEYSHDDYLNMMAQTLSDRLAEATAEKLHEEVRKDRAYWGYAPDENLTIEQQHREEYQGHVKRFII